MIVAALYVETDGAYFGLDGVEPWDEARRDAPDWFSRPAREGGEQTDPRQERGERHAFGISGRATAPGDVGA